MRRGRPPQISIESQWWEVWHYPRKEEPHACGGKFFSKRSAVAWIATWVNKQQLARHFVRRFEVASHWETDIVIQESRP